MSPFSCHGGVDVNTFSYITPCSECYLRLYPATQDLDNFELDSFLDDTLFDGLSSSDPILNDLSDTLIWGYQHSDPELVHDVMNTIHEVQDNWPKINIPLDLQSKASDGRTYRYYKPFGSKSLSSKEYNDFKDFLRFIF